MIVKMMKYNIVLFSAEREHFVERLRELGMVDITTSGWEPTEADRELISAIDGRTKAVNALEAFAQSDDYVADAKAIETGKVYEAYLAAQSAIAAAKSENARLQKVLEEWLPWGEFDCSTLQKLADSGVVLRYFTAQRSTYDRSVAEWSEMFNIAVVSEDSAAVRFVVIGDGSEEIAIDAQELKAPTQSNTETKAQIEQNDAEIAAQYAVISAAADAKAEVEAEITALKRAMQDVRIEATADKAAEGLLLVMEGWAEKETSAEVDKLLDEYPSVVYIKEDPTPEDETPVKLKNNRFARLFEMIGGLYALPKYGTLDMTPFFAPFYMLFFAICLNDAGYGAILLAAGIALALKGGKGMRQAAYLTMVCGGATTLFGIFTGSLFGMSIPELMGYEKVMVDGVATFPEYPLPYFDFQGLFFNWALALGVFQILLGMLLDIVFKARCFGITTVFGKLGWFIVLLSACLAGGLKMLDENWVIPGFTTSSVAFYVAMGVGVLLMLVLNNVKRNPIVNVASGLWDTYNNLTGLLSDVLSYIRLFAIGLSGGVLAQVFNSLAMGLTGLDAGIEHFGVGTIFQIVGAAAILLIGHGINLFMSSISSFVHPMRLTFVEFYKNAGFEMTTRAFEPIKK